MSDSRYPWEKDPLSEPPHTAQRFDNNLELVARLKAALELAKQCLSIREGSNEGLYSSEIKLLAEIAKLEGGSK